jgi:pyruvate,orthophosphate dikinase
MTQWVDTFGDGKAEGQAGMKNLLGGKGANLAEMSNLGLSVPPEFTTAIQVCIKPLHRALQQTDGAVDN